MVRPGKPASNFGKSRQQLSRKMHLEWAMGKQAKNKKMNADQPKRRSESQRIGHEGEAIFHLWAVQNRLKPHEASLDSGIDFDCECMKVVATGAQEATGTVLAVSVVSQAVLSRLN